MGRELSLFIGTFTTLLAIINPLEVLPVYLKLLEGKDVATHRQIAWKSCVYALLLILFFLIFGTLMMRLFGVPLAMVRIVGGIILRRRRTRRKHCLCAARVAADVRSGCNRDDPWDGFDN